MTKGYIKHTTVVPLGLLTTVLLSGLVLSSSIVSADNDSVVDEINITVPASCTMTGTGMDSHSTEIQNGIYKDDIGTTTLHAFCNDNEGFAIYAAGYTGNEIGGTNSNKLVGTTASSNATIVSGIATTAGSPDISNWAMKLAISQDSGDTTSTNAFTIDSAPNVDLPSQAEQSATPVSFSEYHVVPNEYVKVAHKNSMTDMTASTGGVKLTTTYAAYISKTQPADTYSGQVIYTLVHPSDAEAPLSPRQATAGCINYFANASSALGEMGCQTISDSDTSATLYASNFKRDGYGFAGWSDKYDYATNPNANFYGPNQTITFTAGEYTGSNNGLALYAVWIKSEGSLQDSSKVTGFCGTNGTGGALTQAPADGTATLSSVTALTDERDGNTYAIAKLADGKCWTIENLRLADKDSNNNDINLSSTNTHNPSLPLTNIYDSSTTSNHLSPTSSVAYNATNAPEGWCDTNSSACDNQSRLRTDNTVLFTSNAASGYGDVYSYGNYYNWYSATAGHGKYGSSYGSSFTSPGDICPYGWHLPTGTSSGEYYALNTAINAGSTSTNAGLRTYPANFVYSGDVNGSSVLSRNSSGLYWSASGYNSDRAYFFGFNSGRVYPGTSYVNKYYGRMVRCVAGV